MDASVHTAECWWRQSPTDLLRDLAAVDGGLSAKEAKRRLERYGPNRFHDQRERTLVVQFLRRFRNPLVLTLIVWISYHVEGIRAKGFFGYLKGWIPAGSRTSRQ